MSELSRRDFLSATAAAAAGSMVPAVAATAQDPTPRPSGPTIVSSGNGMRATEKAAEMILGGADTLDAVIAGVNIVEEDPNDASVGYGGLPNEEGVVELDSSVMHGPTARGGAVGALRNIKTPSKVAKLVMERTDHVLLVGEGALRFARAHGFEEFNLLTDRARRSWLRWKENVSDRDDWIAPPDDGTGRRGRRGRGRRGGGGGELSPEDLAAFGPDVEIIDGIPYTYGTINCCAVNAAGDLSGVTTTSGLSWKIPGRVGDSPILGAGLFVDNEVGAAGSTGRGEAVIQICGAHTVVEAMRNGMSPEEACLHGCKRIVDYTKEPRLLNEDGRPNFDVNFYAVSKDGRYGGARIYRGERTPQYSVYANGENRREPLAYLYERRGTGR